MLNLMKAPVLFALTLMLLASCSRISQGPYKNYKITDDEAIPASKVGGAPWRHRR